MGETKEVLRVTLEDLSTLNASPDYEIMVRDLLGVEYAVDRVEIYDKREKIVLVAEKKKLGLVGGGNV